MERGESVTGGLASEYGSLMVIGSNVSLPFGLNFSADFLFFFVSFPIVGDIYFFLFLLTSSHSFSLGPVDLNFDWHVLGSVGLDDLFIFFYLHTATFLQATYNARDNFVFKLLLLFSRGQRTLKRIFLGSFHNHISASVYKIWHKDVFLHDPH